jgi:hypothetical protein
MNDEPLSWKIERLRGQLVDLGCAIRQLQPSGLDSASPNSSRVRGRSWKKNFDWEADARRAKVPAAGACPEALI